jgi:hypothetical protein
METSVLTKRKRKRKREQSQIAYPLRLLKALCKKLASDLMKPSGTTFEIIKTN